MTEVSTIYPGTFDPITFGHLDIIKRAANIFPHLIVAIAEDTSKSPLFTLEERTKMVENEVARLKLSNIKVIPFKGLLVDFARKQGASVILRGLRAASDFEYEFQMSYMNFKIAPDIATIFIPANENGHFIASRFVKQLSRLGGDISGFVSKDVAEKLKLKFAHE
jgi:pantetheine-phosphate adenylyltransferase